MACLLADRLRSPPAAPADKPCGGTAGPDAALWRSDALDRLAEALAESELLTAQPAAPRLLGSLLAGGGQ